MVEDFLARRVGFPSVVGRRSAGLVGWIADPCRSNGARVDILSGLRKIEATGDEIRTFRAGERIATKRGSVGIWRTIETVRKIYICVYQ